MKQSTAVVIVLALFGATAVAVDHGPRIRTLLRGPPDTDLLATAIGEALRERSEALGSIKVQDGSVLLAGGKLRLTVQRQDDGDEEAGKSAHFHVLAALEGVPSASIDACAIGVGHTPEERFKDLAGAFSGTAFPPIWSRFTGEPSLDTRPFWGDEPWAVQGFRGYAGPVSQRAVREPMDLEDADFFSEIPFLPGDGRLHLVKSVLLSKGGFWERSIELDGKPTSITGARWDKVPAIMEIGMAIRFAVYDERDVPPTADARRVALERLDAKEDWLFPADACPSEVMPEKLLPHSYSPMACRGGRLLDCLKRCEQGRASYCYSAALETQDEGSAKAGSEALFLRACRLGFDSGCTNRAAGIVAAKKGSDACALQTFERVCERSGDPWACTMFGNALARGDGLPRNPERARSVLGEACRNGDDDPACTAARSVLKGLDGERAATASDAGSAP